jgi:hypothetical protein
LAGRCGTMRDKKKKNNMMRVKEKGFGMSEFTVVLR